MKKIIICICVATISPLFINAQSATEADKKETIKEEIAEPEEYHAKGLLHQIYLENKARSIQELEYEKDGEKLKGKISEDGKRIILENYHKRGRVKVTYTTESGEQKTVSKSSCYIDVVIPL